MNYVEKVEHGRGLVSDSTVLPPDVFAYVLSLRSPEALERRATPALLANIDPQTLRYEKARTIGNASVRFAVSSYLASLHQPESVEFIGDMDQAEQDEILDDFFADYDGHIGMSNAEAALRLFETKRSMISTTDRVLMMGSYVNFWAGSYRPGYRPQSFGQNDSLLVQAFGRNTFSDAQLPTVVAEYKKAGSDEAMFEGFLADAQFDEGASNRVLADAVADVLQDKARIIEPIMQWEVSYSLWSRYPELFAAHRSGIHTLWPQSGFYPTYDVKADSIAVMRERGLLNPLELAHPDMMIRALGILARQGVQADALDVPVPFDAASTQSQTRDRWQWMLREFPTRVHHVLTNRVRF